MSRFHRPGAGPPWPSLMAGAAGLSAAVMIPPAAPARRPPRRSRIRPSAATGGSSSPAATGTVVSPAPTNVGEPDQAQLNADATDPLRMLTSDHDAIARGDYQRAYGYWRQPQQSHYDSPGVRHYPQRRRHPAPGVRHRRGCGPAADGDRRGDPQHPARWHVADVRRRSRCPAVGPGMGAPTGDEWRIDEAQVAPAANAPIADLLATGCDAYNDRLANYGQHYDNKSGPLNVVASLYDAVNRHDWQRALGDRQQPPGRPSHFAAGYAGTRAVAVTAGAPTGAAPPPAASTTRARVIIDAVKTDCTLQRFAGCYVVRRSNLAENGRDPAENPCDLHRRPSRDRAMLRLLRARARLRPLVGPECPCRFVVPLVLCSPNFRYHRTKPRLVSPGAAGTKELA